VMGICECNIQSSVSLKTEFLYQLRNCQPLKKNLCYEVSGDNVFPYVRCNCSALKVKLAQSSCMFCIVSALN
jgi:hypothetical protein